jgi:hypothetical protein
MAENTTRGFNFAKGKDFTPYAGEAVDCLPFDGYVAVALTGSATFDSKPNERGERVPMIRINGVVQDEGEGQGMRILSNLHLDGTDRNGGWMGRQFLEFMHSCGTTLETIVKNAESGVVINDANLIVKKFMEEKRLGYLEVEADVYDGRETTRVKNWISKEKYEQARLVGAHRRKRRAVGTAPASGAVANLGGGGAMPMAAANGTAAAASASALPML